MGHAKCRLTEPRERIGRQGHKTLRLRGNLSSLLSYSVVGVVNTLVHWCVFLGLVFAFSLAQGTANLLAFACAVTVSFILNARFTFKSALRIRKYIMYVLFMGALSYGVGTIAQVANFHPFVTLVVFTAVSFLIGFLYSRFVVFAETAS